MTDLQPNRRMSNEFQPSPYLYYTANSVVVSLKQLLQFNPINTAYRNVTLPGHGTAYISVIKNGTDVLSNVQFAPIQPSTSLVVTPKMRVACYLDTDDTLQTKVGQPIDEFPTPYTLKRDNEIERDVSVDPKGSITLTDISVDMYGSFSTNRRFIKGSYNWLSIDKKICVSWYGTSIQINDDKPITLECSKILTAMYSSITNSIVIVDVTFINTNPQIKVYNLDGTRRKWFVYNEFGEKVETTIVASVSLPPDGLIIKFSSNGESLYLVDFVHEGLWELREFRFTNTSNYYYPYTILKLYEFKYNPIFETLNPGDLLSELPFSITEFNNIVSISFYRNYYVSDTTTHSIVPININYVGYNGLSGTYESSYDANMNHTVINTSYSKVVVIYYNDIGNLITQDLYPVDNRIENNTINIAAFNLLYISGSAGTGGVHTAVKYSLNSTGTVSSTSNLTEFLYSIPIKDKDGLIDSTTIYSTTTSTSLVDSTTSNIYTYYDYGFGSGGGGDNLEIVHVPGSSSVSGSSSYSLKVKNSSKDITVHSNMSAGVSNIQFTFDGDYIVFSYSNTTTESYTIIIDPVTLEYKSVSPRIDVTSLFQRIYPFYLMPDKI